MRARRYIKFGTPFGSKFGIKFAIIFTLSLGLGVANWSAAFAASDEQAASSSKLVANSSANSAANSSETRSEDATTVPGCPPPKSHLVRWAEDVSWTAKGAANQIGLTAAKEKIIQQLTTIFENGTKDFQYASISQLNDGKGLNVGRVGFNTKAGTLQILVKQYLSAGQDHPSAAQQELKKFLPCLTKIQGTGEYECLYPNAKNPNKQALLNVDFGKAWKDASADPVMKHLQDQFVTDSYLEPALKLANKVKLQSVIARAFIYDSVVQSGEGGADRLLEEAKRAFQAVHGGRGTPTTQAEETEWLKYFNSARSRLLSHEKVDTSTRVHALSALLESGNMDLQPPLTVRYHGTFELGSGSSGG